MEKIIRTQKRYLLLLSTSFSSAILWDHRVICLPVATVAVPALGAVVAAARRVAAVVAVTGDLVLAAEAVAAATAGDLVPLPFFLVEEQRW